MRLSRILLANGLLFIGAMMENPNNKVVPFYFMTLAAMLEEDLTVQMATEDGRKRLDRFFLIREGGMPKGLTA